jgi:Cytochrome c7 and related cytochrome c
MAGPFKDKEHLLRVAALFAAGILAFVLLRELLVPPGFGAYGHYRPGAIDDNRSQPVRYAGQAVCVECHTDVAQIRAHGKHARVACEACHGALAGHGADPEAVKAVRPDPKTLCIVCHASNMAKPAGFPQIDSDHPDAVCTECHVAHDPGSAPEEAQ